MLIKEVTGHLLAVEKYEVKLDAPKMKISSIIQGKDVNDDQK